MVILIIGKFDCSNAHNLNCTLILTFEAGLACTKKVWGEKKPPTEVGGFMTSLALKLN